MLNMKKKTIYQRLLLSLIIGIFLNHLVLAETALTSTSDSSNLSEDDQETYQSIYTEILRLEKKSTEQRNKPELSVQALYDAFKFNSTIGDFYNRFYGRTQFINLGGDNIDYHDVTVGLTVTAINTRMNGSLSLAPQNYQYTTTSIDNTAIHAHVTRQLSEQFSIDIAGGLGHSQFSLTNTAIFPKPGSYPLLQPIPTVNEFGRAYLSGFNEYLGGRFTAMKGFNKFNLQGDAGYIFSNYQQPGYTINYTNGTSTPVLSLITRIGLLTENARLSYQVNDYLQPYIMGGLIQVVSLSYSNPITQPTSISPLPQLSFPDSGFLLGTGLSYTYKFFRVSPLYQFTQRGTNYFDNLGALKLDLIF